MTTNHDITLYYWRQEIKTYERQYFDCVHLEDIRIQKYTRDNALSVDDSVHVIIPWADECDLFHADGHSRIVVGKCMQEITETYSITDLARDYGALLIQSCAKNKYGSRAMWNAEVIAK